MSNEKIFPRTAPQGKYRVIGVNIFDGTDNDTEWVELDCSTLESAKEHANRKILGQHALGMCVYNDAGRKCYDVR